MRTSRDIARDYAYKKLNESWKSRKSRLYKKASADGTKSLQETIDARPRGLQDAQLWENFVKFKRSAAGRVGTL